MQTHLKGRGLSVKGAVPMNTSHVGVATYPMYYLFITSAVLKNAEAHLSIHREGVRMSHSLS